jgi:ATP-dependent exoDNAse (exonuclease V) alpha subunit
VLDKVIEILKHQNLFLTGGAGVGKSYLTNQIIDHYTKLEMGVVPLGSTGVSAVNIGGFTLHSFFVFGISNNFEELAQSDKRARKRISELKKILKATELIIIDEISMVSTELLDMIEFRLRNSGYRGKLLIVGDFFQLPPVQKGYNKNSLIDEAIYAFESRSWRAFDFEVIELTDMKRTTDRLFTHILHKIRVGICDKEVVEYLQNLQHNSRVYESNPTLLYGRNLEVEQTNRAKLNELESEETLLFSNIELFGNPNPKRVESWRKLLPISDILTIKVGAPILFCINKWGSFVNGERGVITTIEDEYIIVEKDNEFVRVERHEFDLVDMVAKDDGTVEKVSIATLSQFPIKLAYAVTIHKSQGMSIDRLVCNVDNIFAPSQFYVAISRATDPKTLQVEFTKGHLESYLKRVIRVDSRVVEYYRGIE